MVASLTLVLKYQTDLKADFKKKNQIIGKGVKKGEQKGFNMDDGFDDQCITAGNLNVVRL